MCVSVCQQCSAAVRALSARCILIWRVAAAVILTPCHWYHVIYIVSHIKDAISWVRAAQAETYTEVDTKAMLTIRRPACFKAAQMIGIRGIAPTDILV